MPEFPFPLIFVVVMLLGREYATYAVCCRCDCIAVLLKVALRGSPFSSPVFIDRSCNKTRNDRSKIHHSSLATLSLSLCIINSVPFTDVIRLSIEEEVMPPRVREAGLQSFVYHMKAMPTSSQQKHISQMALTMGLLGTGQIYAYPTLDLKTGKIVTAEDLKVSPRPSSLLQVMLLFLLCLCLS